MKEERVDFETWEMETAESILKFRDSSAPFNALKRILETSTCDISMEAFGDNDPDAIPRQTIPKDIDAAPHPVASFKELPDKNRIIKISEKGITAPEAQEIISQLNQLVFGSEVPRRIAVENQDTEHLPIYCYITSSILYKYLGDRVINVVLALQEWAARDLFPELRGKTYAESVSLKEVDMTKKHEMVENYSKLIELPEISEKNEKSFLEIFFGKSVYRRLIKGSRGKIENTLGRFSELIEKEEKFRYQMGWVFANIPTITHGRLASSFIHQGFRTLENIETPTEYERWMNIKAEHEALENSPESKAVLFEVNPEYEQEHHERGEALRGYFETHTPPAPKRLSDEIDCEKYKKELKALNTTDNLIPYNAKQREIACRVFSAVQEYQTPRKNPPYKSGMPTSIVENKEITCFGGPWLMATMLLKCGINYDDILYAHVNETYPLDNGRRAIGGHGMLLLKTRMHDLLAIDHGFNIPAKDFPFGLCRSGKMLSDFRGFLNGKVAPPVALRFKEEITESLKVHPDMQIMPLHDGLMSGHLLHVGIDFFNDGRMEEAKYTLEMAFRYNPKDADILYYLGLIEFKKKNYPKAEKYFEKALEAFNGHLLSIFSLGELAIIEEDMKKAEKLFGRVATDERMMFSITPQKEDDELQGRAKKYVSELINIRDE